MLLFSTLADLSRAMAATRSRNEKVRLVVELLRSLEPEDVAPAVSFLVAEPRAGAVGLGIVGLHELRETKAAATPSVSVADVERAFEALRSLPPAEIAQRARPLFESLTHEEQRFLASSMTGSLRQGGLAGIMQRAVAEASGRSEEEVRRATMVMGGVAVVAARALGSTLQEGRDQPLPREVTLFTPVSPMLASTAETVREALSSVTRARVEWKVDGVRAQIHTDGERLAVYSRQGNDVTRGVKGALDPLASTKGSWVLDAEIVLLEADGRACPFQETFSVASSGRAPERGRTLRLFAFDCLVKDGVDLLDVPLEERVRALAAIVPDEARMPAIDAPPSEASAEAFYRAALARGHEGVLVKDLGSPYTAGARSPSWFKVKKVVTFDLVILAAEWGSGRRKGYLSNLHLGARNADGTFCMVGKTFKGLTDAMLREQTEKLLALETHREDYVVFVKPEIVVEIGLNDVQRSPRYPGGVALRFARVKRYRSDKRADEADTIESVAALAPQAPPSRQLSLFGER